jgi:hypothetical protein
MNSCFCYPYNQHTPDDPKFCPINKFIHSGNPCDVCYKYDTDELIILNYMGALHFMDNSTKKLNKNIEFEEYAQDSASVEYPSAICIQPCTSNILVCDNRRDQVVMANTNGEYITRIGNRYYDRGHELLQRPQGIDCDYKGNIFVSDLYNYLTIFDTAGRSLKRTKASDNGNGLGICVTELNTVVISNNNFDNNKNSQISIWSADGSEHLLNVGIGSGSGGVCTDLRGYLLCSCNDGIEVYEPRQNFKKIKIHKVEEKFKKFKKLKYFKGLCVDDKNIVNITVYDPMCVVQQFIK